ncbi:MAG: DUF3883 domain-containing protein [Gemmatimonadaceae bacterium]
MLTKELKGEPYSKTAHRNALAAQLEDRSDGSIERKHQNISAVLIAVGYPYIPGYKPLGNYQRLLADVVVERVTADQHLAGIVSAAVSKPATPPPIKGILDSVEPPPEGTPFSYFGVSEALASHGQHINPHVDYLEREAQNRSLGRAGEEFVVAFERARLIQVGEAALAEKVEHVAVTKGDGYGFDIRSFESNGRDRVIEVKTTAYGKQTPFFVTRNEVSVSKVREGEYHLYRLFVFRDNPRLYWLKGSLEQTCTLESVQFSARPR